MTVRAIIIADGKGERWGNYLGKPKHLVRLGGETILHRAVRLLRTYGVSDIIISARDPRYAISGAKRLEPEDNELETDKFYAIRDWWNHGGETIIVYGDCFFTDQAMRLICKTTTSDTELGVLFFGRFNPSALTGKNWGELFAVRVSNYTDFANSCKIVRDGFADGTVLRGGGWEIYRHISGRDPNSEHMPLGNFVEIDDYTDDFDFPADYDRFLTSWDNKENRYAVRRALLIYGVKRILRLV